MKATDKLALAQAEAAAAQARVARTAATNASPTLAPARIAPITSAAPAPTTLPAAAQARVAVLETTLAKSEAMTKTFQDLYETVRLEKNEILKKIVDAYAKGWT